MYNTYAKLDNDAELALIYTTDIEIGQEVFFLKRLVDTLLSTIHTMRHNIRSAFKSFKRSEIRQFTEKHSTTMSNIYGIDYVKIKDLPVDIPNGMKTNYLPVTNTIVSLLQGFDIDELVSDLENIMSTIEKADTITKAVRPRHNKKIIAMTMKKYFVKSPTGKVPFKKVFKDMNEFKEVATILLNNCDELYERTITISKRMDALDSRLDTLITKAEDTRDFDRKTMTTLRDALTVLCDEIELFGVLSLELQRVEHNFTLVLHTLDRSI